MKSFLIPKDTFLPLVLICLFLTRSKAFDQSTTLAFGFHVMSNNTSFVTRIETLGFLLDRRWRGESLREDHSRSHEKHSDERKLNEERDSSSLTSSESWTYLYKTHRWFDRSCIQMLCLHKRRTWDQLNAVCSRLEEMCHPRVSSSSSKYLRGERTFSRREKWKNFLFVIIVDRCDDHDFRSIVVVHVCRRFDNWMT